MKRIKRLPVAVCFLLGLLLVCAPRPAFAIPQFALFTGNRCVNCHINAQGAGLRDELGWYSMEGTGLIDPDRSGIGGVFGESNSFLNGALLLGGDFRLQTVRSHQSPDAERRVFPMQGALYSAYRAGRGVQFEASYNFGPKKYSGQQSWTASVLIQPGFAAPQLRIGYIQPSIGVRYDDHTMLARQISTVLGPTPLIAPNYAEYGAELRYYRYRWLSVTAGVYNARSLAENTVLDPAGRQISLIADEDHPSLLGRVAFRPQAADGLLNFHLGASILDNGDFTLTNLFGGVGLRDRLSVMAEYAASDKEDIRETRSVTVDLSYQALNSLILTVRGERGTATHRRDTGTKVEVLTRQAVFGAQVFVLPHAALRPEYRLVDTETFRSTRYAVQLHVFY